jgi:hypothetical protein
MIAATSLLASRAGPRFTEMESANARWSDVKDSRPNARDKLA